MTLRRKLLLSQVPLLLALLALVAVHAVLARQALRSQLAAANREAAAVLAELETDFVHLRTDMDLVADYQRKVFERHATWRFASVNPALSSSAHRDFSASRVSSLGRCVTTLRAGTRFMFWSRKAPNASR